MRTATARLVVISGVLVLAARLVLLDLRDQLVDSLDHVRPILVGFQQLAVEGADALAALLELAAQARVLGALLAVGGRELGDHLLEPFEVVAVGAGSIRAGLLGSRDLVPGLVRSESLRPGPLRPGSFRAGFGNGGPPSRARHRSRRPRNASRRKRDEKRGGARFLAMDQTCALRAWSHDEPHR